jgi:hypothetical protein
VQQQYKMCYDRAHRVLDFEVDQWVWLRVLHQAMASLDVKGKGKLGQKYYGPFHVIEHMRRCLQHQVATGRVPTRCLSRRAPEEIMR